MSYRLKTSARGGNPQRTFAWSGRFLGGLFAILVISALGLGSPAVATAQGVDESSLPSIPDYFQQKGQPRTNSAETQSVNELINNFTGKLQYTFTDLVIPGNGGMDLVVQRSYNSIDDPLVTLALWSDYEYSPAGLGWTMHMGRVIRGANKGICTASWASASANPVLELPDGSRQILYEDDSPTLTWLTKDFWRAKCVAGYLHVQSPNGTTYEMTTIGHMFGAPSSKQKAYYPSKITDRNGNWFNITYQFLPYGVLAMSQITASDGRSVAFSYSGSTLASVTDTTSSPTRTWQYTVSSGPGGHVYLDKVDRPDGLSWKYSYHQASPGIGSMSRIEYPSAGSIDYAYSHVDFKAGTPRYGSSTVVASKTAGTNTAGLQTGTWTWAYEVATNPLPSTVDGTWINYQYSVPPPDRSQVNVTSVTDPNGNLKEHFHFGIQSVPQAATRVGLFIGTVSDFEYTLLGYEHIQISSQQDVVANMFTNAYYYPDASVVNYYVTMRAGETYEVAKYDYDNWGNPSTIVEMGTNNDDRTYTRQTDRTYNIDTTKWRLRQVASETVAVDGQTHATTRQFDSNGNMLSQSVAGVPAMFTYHSTGDLQTHTNAKGQVTSFGDYHRGTARSEVQPGSVILTRSVDGAGNITSATNGRGKTSTYAYDSLNRVTAITRPEGNPIAITWGATSRKVQRGSMADLTTMDGMGRVVRREVSAPGETPIGVDFRYDMLGQRLFQSYPNSTKGTGYQYDMLGRVITTLHGNPAGTNSANSIEYASYSGLQVTRQDTANRASIESFRAFGSPAERHTVNTIAGEVANNQLYIDASVDITRDLLGQPKTVTMDGKTRTYDYDSRYFLVARTDPETGTTTFGRDAIGNMTSKAIGAAPAITYTYDARNRVTDITYPPSEDPNVPNAASVSRTYNGNDLPVTTVSGTIARSFGYDDGDKLTQETLTVGGTTQTLGYSYNANEALSRITYPSGNLVNYNPDAFGRARAVTPYVTQVNYHPNGMPSEIQYANGVVSAMGINDRQWPSSLELSKGSTSFIDSMYGYDQVGNLTQVNEYADGIYARAFQYDKLDRLIVEASVDGSREYYYDATGNLTYLLTPNALNTYAYGASTGLLDGVTGGVSRAYQYDSAGNVRADGSWTFGHDRANNLRCISCSATTPTQHSYDSDNMRVQTSDGINTTQYLHSQQGLLLQTLKPGVERKEHVYLGRRQVAERRIDLN